jgi:Bacterial PH domain
MTRFSIALVHLLLTVATVVDAFGPTLSTTFRPTRSISIVTRTPTAIYSTNNKESSEQAAAFVPLDTSDDEEEEDDDDLLDKVEMLGKGAAKVRFSVLEQQLRSTKHRLLALNDHICCCECASCFLIQLYFPRITQVKRGKRKGGSSSGIATKVTATKSSLAPEQVYYEGPPAITETIAPTLSILTVVGIIPAAAAWARQAWVRYKITNRRIRVTSGIGGKDMAEIVYPDIVELRTVRRLFGDGDMVAFLRDGAKFEMRNIPEFDTAIEFILQQVDPAVATQYRSKGDVTKPAEQQ